ncbi:MAG: hypothetical protein OXF68_13895, partial [Gammaproteobacteria bacterium]|nr:hypothetical protein [Gammaproteobacteria bacterium]
WLAIAEAAASGGVPLLISADRAWEPPAELAGDGEALRLQGNFRMSGPDWRLTADSAQVYGPVEDPERLVIVGAPARVTLIRRNGEPASGTGERIIYWPRRELVEVHGGAFAAGGLSAASSRIIYDLGEERLESTGEAGVTFVARESAGPQVGGP